ncbi:hypothetical protein A4A49_10103 [Nicotiana attenuata]|uniref:Uncharacterized protein n=1 Tax=Nicotiana attenuata TaxID=49451 RepID=A0A314KXW9_NICAT|nr:hypothetical protein A4A49_10103 [Nicotiana attenuata]
MPSPSIPRSKSVPYNISEAQNSPTNSLIIPPSVRSSKSADSLKPKWPKKANELISRKGGSSSKNSNLTADNLEEFNKRNAIQEEKRYSARSPYYKGLTDSSKLINRQKLLAEFSSSGKDSISASSASSSSKSSLASKVQEWSASYFVRKGKEERTSSSLNTSTGNKNIQDSSSETKDKGVIRTTIGEELGIDRKGVRRSSRKSTHRLSKSDQGKPLRERAPEMQTNIVVLPPAPAPPITLPQKLSIPSPPPTPLIFQTSLQDEEIEAIPLPASPTQTTEDEKNTTKEQDITSPEQKDKRFKWADKYRPNALKDFLCNRNTALELKALGEAVPSIQVNVMESKKHVEINLAETKGYEKHVIVELINERKHKASIRSAPCHPDDCKGITSFCNL